MGLAELMSRHQPDVELIRNLAGLEGVSPDDADVENVLEYLSVLLPKLEELRPLIPSNTTPAALFLPVEPF
jgi:hypothetical protein